MSVSQLRQPHLHRENGVVLANNREAAEWIKAYLRVMSSDYWSRRLSKRRSAPDTRADEPDLLNIFTSPEWWKVFRAHSLLSFRLLRSVCYSLCAKVKFIVICITLGTDNAIWIKLLLFMIYIVICIDAKIMKHLTNIMTLIHFCFLKVAMRLLARLQAVDIRINLRARSHTATFISDGNVRLRQCKRAIASTTSTSRHRESLMLNH